MYVIVDYGWVHIHYIVTVGTLVRYIVRFIADRYIAYKSKTEVNGCISCM